MARTQNNFNSPFREVMFFRDVNLQPVPRSYTDAKSINAIIASNAAEALRGGMYALIPNSGCENLQNRFSRALACWLQATDVAKLPACDNITSIADFQLTTGPSFAERFKVPITIKHNSDCILTVGVNAFVPNQQVMAPEGTSMIELVIAVAGCDLGSGIGATPQVQRIQARYNNVEIPAQTLQFKISADKGSLTVTGAWLQYYSIKNNGMKRLESPEFLPACILNAQYH